jgi:hypothetical protein
MMSSMLRLRRHHAKTFTLSPRTHFVFLAHRASSLLEFLKLRLFAAMVFAIAGGGRLFVFCRFRADRKSVV